MCLVHFLFVEFELILRLCSSSWYAKIYDDDDDDDDDDDNDDNL